jgi:hypothetical protein
MVLFYNGFMTGSQLFSTSVPRVIFGPPDPHISPRDVPHAAHDFTSDRNPKTG